MTLIQFTSVCLARLLIINKIIVKYELHMLHTIELLINLKIGQQQYLCNQIIYQVYFVWPEINKHCLPGLYRMIYESTKQKTDK